VHVVGGGESHRGRVRGVLELVLEHELSHERLQCDRCLVLLVLEFMGVCMCDVYSMKGCDEVMMARMVVDNISLKFVMISVLFFSAFVSLHYCVSYLLSSLLPSHLTRLDVADILKGVIVALQVSL